MTRGRSLIRATALLVLSAIVPVRGQAATQGVTLVGSVSDSLTGVPIATVRVSVRTNLFTVTDSSGAFRLEGIPSGDHELEVARSGFHPRRYRVAIAPNLIGDLSVGSIALVPMPPRVVTVVGELKDGRSGDPVTGAPIGINGRPAALSDDRGAFSMRTLVARAGELNRLTVRRIGYEALDYDFWFAAQDTLVILDLELTPLAQKLPEIVVEGERVVIGGARLAGFNRRREYGMGEFLTREQIRRINPKEVTDLFRRVPGFSVVGQGPARRITPHNASCPAAVIYVDGVRSSTDNLDLLLTPDGIAGIEVFRSTARLPPEYSMTGAESSTCSVVGIWTR